MNLSQKEKQIRESINEKPSKLFEKIWEENQKICYKRKTCCCLIWHTLYCFLLDVLVFALQEALFLALPWGEQSSRLLMLLLDADHLSEVYDC